MIGPTTHYAYHPSRFMSSSPTSSVRSMFPTKWYHRYEHNVYDLFRCKEYDADKRPDVGSPGELCSTTISHRRISVFIDKFYALQNGPPNSSQQIYMWTTLRNSLMPSKTPFCLAPSAKFPHFYANGRAANPTAVKTLVDWQYTPVPASSVERAKSGMS